METLPAVRLYGKRGSPQAYAIRDFLQRSDVPFEWVELANHEQARAELGLESVDDSHMPVCIFPDGTRSRGSRLTILKRANTSAASRPRRRAPPKLIRLGY